MRSRWRGIWIGKGKRFNVKGNDLIPGAEGGDTETGRHADTETLTCQTPGCKEPFAVRVGDVLIIRSRHHGRVHVNRVRISESANHE